MSHRWMQGGDVCPAKPAQVSDVAEGAQDSGADYALPKIRHGRLQASCLDKHSGAVTSAAPSLAARMPHSPQPDPISSTRLPRASSGFSTNLLHTNLACVQQGSISEGPIPEYLQTCLNPKLEGMLCQQSSCEHSSSLTDSIAQICCA